MYDFRGANTLYEKSTTRGGGAFYRAGACTKMIQVNILRKILISHDDFAYIRALKEKIKR